MIVTLACCRRLRGVAEVPCDPNGASELDRGRGTMGIAGRGKDRARTARSSSASRQPRAKTHRLGEHASEVAQSRG